MANSRSEYAPSILQDEEDMGFCFVCGRCDRKLDRHEVLQGPYRQKSKTDGLWIMLCHEDCHEGKNGVHRNRELREYLSKYAQKMAMATYGWSLDEWRERYGKNWLDDG